jgi:RNA polymerase sigma-70 factor (ECF subfamily)
MADARIRTGNLPAANKSGTIEPAGKDVDGRMNDTIETVSLVDADPLRDLLVAVAGGDVAAFERLYHSTSAKLFGICLRVLKQRSDAEDVLQDVYTTIWRKANQYDAARASAMTWLAMLTRNKSIDRLRAAGKERRSTPLDLAEDVHDQNPSALAATETSDENRRLNTCLGELDVQRRNLILVAFFEGVTYEELAARCGSPLGTVKSWIRRGLLRLKACLER